MKVGHCQALIPKTPYSQEYGVFSFLAEDYGQCPAVFMKAGATQGYRLSRHLRIHARRTASALISEGLIPRCLQRK